MKRRYFLHPGVMFIGSNKYEVSAHELHEAYRVPVPITECVIVSEHAPVYRRAMPGDVHLRPDRTGGYQMPISPSDALTDLVEATQALIDCYGNGDVHAEINEAVRALTQFKRLRGQE